MVVFSHSFTIFTIINHDPLLAVTHGQLQFGVLAVDFFFIISGYLITNSWVYSRGLLDYLKKRVLRIYPGLAGALLFCVFIVGPLGGADISSYFRNPQTYHFFKAILMADPAQYLPGVFTHNPWRDVNGPLWTIRYEFGCYLILALLGLFGVLKKRLFVLLLLAISIILFQVQVTFNVKIPHLAPGGFPRLLNYFLAGTTFYLYRDKIVYSPHLFIICALLLLLGSFAGMSVILPICGTYILLYLAYSPLISLNHFARWGDFSYGIYLYGWPIQQLLVYYYVNRLTSLSLFFISLVLATIIAAISWHVIEAPLLKLKSRAKPETNPVQKSSIAIG